MSSNNRHCTLLAGPFASFIQGCLAIVCISILIIKRQQENPRREWFVWFLDVMKQGIGSSFGHFSNIYVSMIIAQSLVASKQERLMGGSGGSSASAASFLLPSSSSFATTIVTLASTATPVTSSNNSAMPGDECQWYCLTYFIDSTFGTLWNLFWLQLFECYVVQSPYLYRVFNFGDYGHPPQLNIFLAQLFVWLVFVVSGKMMIIALLYQFLFPLNDVMNYLFRSISNQPELELILVMIIIPAILNTAQFWVTDTFLKQQLPSEPSASSSISQTSSNSTIVSSAPYELAEELIYRSGDEEDGSCDEEDECELSNDVTPSLFLKKPVQYKKRKRVVRASSPLHSFEYDRSPPRLSSSQSSGEWGHQAHRISRTVTGFGWSVAKNIYEIVGFKYLFQGTSVSSTSSQSNGIIRPRSSSASFHDKDDDGDDNALVLGSEDGKKPSTRVLSPHTINNRINQTSNQQTRQSRGKVTSSTLPVNYSSTNALSSEGISMNTISRQPQYTKTNRTEERKALP